MVCCVQSRPASTVYSELCLIEVQHILCVPDHGSRDHNVVLVRRTVCLGKPRGSGIWNGEGMGRDWGEGGQCTSNLGPQWPGSHHAKRGTPSKLKGMEGKLTREIARGIKKGGLHHNLVLPIHVRVYNIVLMQLIT